MLVLLSGTLVTTIIWCLYLGIRNRSLSDYLKCGTPKALAGNYLIRLVSRISLVHAIYFLRNGKKQNGTIHIYIMGYSGGSDHRICHSLGIIQKRMEGCFNKSLYSYGSFNAYYNTFIIFDRYKRFIINHEYVKSLSGIIILLQGR